MEQSSRLFPYLKRVQPPLHSQLPHMGRLIYGYVKGLYFFMPFYDSEAIERAGQVDLLTYLQTCELQELVHVSGNVYCTKTHDSLRISNSKWCWFSRGIGGYSVLDYLIKVNGYSFLEAMETISGRAAIPPPSFVPAPKEEKSKHGIDWRRHNPVSYTHLRKLKEEIYSG